MMSQIKHSAESSKYLLNAFIIAMVVIHSLILIVGKNYYDRFIKLESEDDQSLADLEILKNDMNDAHERIDFLQNEITLISGKLMNQR